MRFRFTDGSLIDTRKIKRKVFFERPVKKWWYFEFLLNNYEIPFYLHHPERKFYLRREFWRLDCDSPFYYKLDYDDLYFITLFFCSKKYKMMPGIDLMVVLFYTDLDTLLHL